jgi:two-component system CheB/CheR fusion protein
MRQEVDIRYVVTSLTRDVTERKLWEQRQQLMLGEFSHRVKNTLAVVQPIAHQTLRGSASAEDFVERFDGRLVALAGAHSLLIKSDWRGADSRRAGAQSARALHVGEPRSFAAGGRTGLAAGRYCNPVRIGPARATNAATHVRVPRTR